MTTIDEKINRRAAAKGVRIDGRTGRPDNAYPMPGYDDAPAEYVKSFSESLGLKPAPTLFGKKLVNV